MVSRPRISTAKPRGIVRYGTYVRKPFPGLTVQANYAPAVIEAGQIRYLNWTDASTNAIENAASNRVTAAINAAEQRVSIQPAQNPTHNSLTGDCVITLMKNGVATSSVLTIPAGLTGEFYDVIAPAIAFNVDDRISLKVDTTAAVAGSVKFQWGKVS